MNITAGSRLGPYEVVAPLGAGGMGEVWRGRDTRLDRSVAIKVLPAEFSENAQFKLRFEREARAISQLNHPNICTLYDVGDGYLVMELLEGESLADRLSKGPLPLEQVLRFGSQIADGLDKAHRHGIVHRDLKPGNIMITKGGAKLLDFGLAKSGAPASAAFDGPTEHRPLTQEGVILGTFQYMAPEQLDGEEADARTDIFALGAVLYEMAAGTRAFQGKSKTSLIAAIVSAEPKPISALQPLTPPGLEHVIGKCLAKERDDRWQSAHDIAQELRWISQTPEAVKAPKKRSSPFVAAGAALFLALAGIAAGRFISHPSDAHVVRFTIPTSEGQYHDAWLSAPSPDGKRLVLRAVNKEGIAQLWIRNLDSLEVLPIPGTEIGFAAPLFGTSPKWALFLAADQRHLRKLDLDTKTVETVGDLGEQYFGSSINDEGTILYAARDVIWMKHSDAAPQPVTQLDRGAKEVSHRWPTFLPDGNHFLFVSRGDPSAPRPGVLYLASIDSPKRIAVTDSLQRAVYAGAYLFLPRDKKLMAFPFDAKRGTITGGGAVIAERINTAHDTGWSAFNVTESGVLTYRIRLDESKLLWLDPNGRTTGSVGPIANYGDLKISPDGKRVAVSVEDPQTETYDLWIFGLDRPSAQRVTIDPGDETSVAWSPDQTRLAYVSEDSTGSGQTSIRVHAVDGSETDQVIAKGPNLGLDAWSADGKALFYSAVSKESKRDLWSVDVRGAHAQTVLIRTPFNEFGAQPSRDGHLLLFLSNESGKSQVYVKPLMGPGEKIQVSVDGGELAHWSADGKHIYFINKEQMMVADVKSDTAVHVAEPRRLFQLSFSLNDYDVTPDGRFLFIAPVERSEWAPTAVVVNWQQALKERP